MPSIILKLWDKWDNEILIWMPYGLEPKKKRMRSASVKMTRWQKIKAMFLD